MYFKKIKKVQVQNITTIKGGGGGGGSVLCG